MKEAWSLKKAALNQSAEPNRSGRIILSGGSSVLVGVPPQIIQSNLNRSVVNLGMAAGMGPDVLLQLALNEIRKGDVLVVMLEPDLLTMPNQGSMLGGQISWATGNPNWLPNQSIPDWLVSLSLLRPGGYHACTLIGKIISGRKLYRYSLNELQPGGWQAIHTPEQPYDLGIPVFYYSLTENSRLLLQQLNESITSRGAHCVYIPSLHFCPTERFDYHLSNLSSFLNEVEKFIPVIRPDNLNISSNSQDFADTPWHPLPAIAEQNAENLSQFISTFLDEIKAD